jgi:hypothetical protein
MLKARIIFHILASKCKKGGEYIISILQMLEKDQKLTYDCLFKIIKKKYGISEIKHIRKYFIEGTGVPHF